MAFFDFLRKRNRTKVRKTKSGLMVERNGVTQFYVNSQGKVLKPEEALSGLSSGTGSQVREPGFESSYRLKFDAKGLNLELYDTIKSAIPMAGSAVFLYVSLVGAPEITFSSDAVQRAFNEFRETVMVNSFSENRGLDLFLTQALDAAITKGFNVGELLLSRDRRFIEKIVIGSPNTFNFYTFDTKVVLGQKVQGGTVNYLENNGGLLYLSYGNEEGRPEGISMFRSLPFVGQIFVTLEHALHENLWRSGSPIYLVKVKGDIAAVKDRLLKYNPRALASGLSKDLKKVMGDRKEGRPGDLWAGFPAGDVSIEIVGQGYTMPDLEIPGRIIREEILATTHLPPYMFPLYKWTATERIGYVQQILLKTNVDHYRTGLTKQVRKIVNIWLILNRLLRESYEIKWSPVDLVDRVDIADIRLKNAQAEEIELRNDLGRQAMGGDVEQNAGAVLNMIRTVM